VTLFLILLTTSLISLITIISAALLGWKVRHTHYLVPALVALAAGTMLSNSMLHLIPEALHTLEAETVMSITLMSFVGFFLLEKIFHWRHCHEIECEEHQYGRLSLIGDSMHNFIDGLMIAAAFIVSPWLGFTTALAIALHEFPQEMGDFGVLILSGFGVRRAIISNFAASLTVIIGGLTGYLFSLELANLIPYLLPITAGNFLYLSASDLIPEMRDAHHSRFRSILVFLLFFAGIFLIPLVGRLMPEHSHAEDVSGSCQIELTEVCETEL
jgi:zinc and cadmium transporter